MKFLLLLLLVCNSFAIDLQKPSVYESSKFNIENWYMSEKLDGIRAYWNGKELLSKQGNKIFAPLWFTKDFPPFELDGELWSKEDDFENIQSIVLSHNMSNNWKEISYNIFEIPNQKGNFDSRLDFLNRWLEKNPNKFIKIIPQHLCKNEQSLQIFLNSILEKKGEGVIIKNPNIDYETGRSKNILKVKEFFDDEALVIAHNLNINGTFKSLKVELKNGITFNLGGGFSKKDRINPPKIGEFVTFKYYLLTKNGKPKFASFLRVRKKE